MDNFVVTTGLKKLLTLKNRKKVIQGGTSAGKTFGILAILIDKAIKEPNLEISIVSESIPHLRRGAMKDFLKIMTILGRFKSNQWNRSTLKYTFANGSYVEFFSVDQPDKLRGARRNVLYVNEANNVPFEAYNQLSIRTSGDIWIDFNPTQAFWAHTEVLKEENVDFVIITYKDNEGLPDTIVQDIESKKKKAETSSFWRNWWDVYGLGKIGNLEGVCIPNWSTVDSIPQEAELLGYGMDFGYSNDPTALVALYKYEDGYIADEIIYQKGLLPGQIATKMEDAEVGREQVFGDPSSPQLIAELQTYGINIDGLKKKGMEKNTILLGIELINDNKLQVTTNSTNLIKELRGYVWDSDRTGKTLNKPVGGFDHIIDALRYSFLGFVYKGDGGSAEYFVY